MLNPVDPGESTTLFGAPSSTISTLRPGFRLSYAVENTDGEAYFDLGYDARWQGSESARVLRLGGNFQYNFGRAGVRPFVTVAATSGPAPRACSVAESVWDFRLLPAQAAYAWTSELTRSWNRSTKTTSSSGRLRSISLASGSTCGSGSPFGSYSVRLNMVDASTSMMPANDAMTAKSGATALNPTPFKSRFLKAWTAYRMGNAIEIALSQAG